MTFVFLLLSLAAAFTALVLHTAFAMLPLCDSLTTLLQAPQSLVRGFASTSGPQWQPEQHFHVRRHFSKQREGTSPVTHVDVDVEGAAAAAGAPDAAAAEHQAVAAAESGPASGAGEGEASSAEADELQAALVTKDKEVRSGNACFLFF